jgi:hypothetical protein
MTTAAKADPATYANYGGNHTIFSSICDGSNPLTWAMINIARLKWLGVAILFAISAALAVWNRRLIKKEAKAASVLSYQENRRTAAAAVCVRHLPKGSYGKGI